MTGRSPAAKCFAKLFFLSLAAVPVLAVIGSLRPKESQVQAALQNFYPTAEVASALRRVAGEDRAGVWNSPEMHAFFRRLTPEERAVFLADVALPWEKQFRRGSEAWSAGQRRRIMMRGIESCEFFGTLDGPTAELLASNASLERAGAEGYDFLRAEPDPVMRLRFQPLLEQMQLLSQSAR